MIKKIKINFKLKTVFWGLSIVFFIVGLAYFHYLQIRNNIKNINSADLLASQKQDLQKQIQSISGELEALKNQDQYLINQDLQKEIDNIQTTYKQTVATYEDILSLKDKKAKVDKLENNLASILTYLSQRNYASASALLTVLVSDIKLTETDLASAFTIPTNIATSNTAPGSGYQRQTVNTSAGTFMVDIVAADLNSTRVIVDTASASNCTNDCPVLALADYVARTGAFAGVNGSYFCPTSYPSCSGKTNTFDTLLMNKDKYYFNSDNNVYSTVPAVIFSGNSARFVGQSLEWGRDTGVDAVIANQPLLVSNGQVVFGGDGDPKKGSKGARSFVGATGSTAYIGVVHNATVAESAITLAALGINNALNLDDGGSTALWFGGYKAGPGRNIPNAVLFIRK